MQIIYSDSEIASKKPNINKKTAVALGNFDGFHIGHMKLLEKIKEYAGQNPETRASCVWTFSEHSQNVLSSEFFVPYITAKEEKAEIAKQKNIDYLIFQDFNFVRYLEPEEFIERVIVGYLGAGLAVCGYNYHFGKNGKGSAKYLRDSLAKKNIETAIIPPVICEGQAVSSSFIRTLIKIGDMPRAKKFLGRPFSIKFPVVCGNRTGRKIGVPTINQLFPEGHIIPACGIYACTCEIGGMTYKAASNIGLRPTVGGEFLNSETHIIGFDGDLYGENIKVNFHMKFRDEIKFNDLGELKSQIKKDIDFVNTCNECER
ncbi:MAG: bifunctional riboflavin kinase/FAD synthetase [Oscillospiraceae bacterium]|nr:bifunctional riboflavin kinase/FAD synthetase [Oscillospiraceae bacterium]